MRNGDAELIRRTLAGDETAFTMLVNKYRKHVHTLAWRKIGDFHIAEDITQETFLQVYRDLATLKEPDRFPGWLYVITTRRCIDWSRKNRLHIRLVENINMAMKGKATYSRHVADEQAKATAEAQREVVKQLLSKLQESERTVMALYYFGEMTCEEISKFLGVSVNTIKSRLSRARQRLKKEEVMIREALNSFQLSANLTENIVREIGRIKPVAPSGSKPLVPWAIAVSTLAMVLLMVGVGNQYLTRFQQPYNFDATSEMTVELIDTSVVLNLESKPDIRTQFGNWMTPVKSNGAGQQRNQPEYLARFAAASGDETEAIIDSDKTERDITLSARTTTESGAHLAEGTFELRRTDTVLASKSYFTRGGSGGVDPSPRYMLLYYFTPHEIDLLRFPLSIGNTWTQTKGQWNSQTKTTLQGYEHIDVSAGTFPDCLKHRTIFTNAETDSQLKNDLVDGTRYLWFAKGIGIVKMRFEHANGIITEAELLEYKIPTNTTEYLPLQIGNAWTYKWRNNYRYKASIEAFKVVENSEELESARYEVTIEADEPRVANVKCVLTPRKDRGGIIELSMSHFGAEWASGGYAHYIRDLTTTDAAGATLPVQELGKNRWIVMNLNKFPITLNYKVLLQHDGVSWAPGPDEAPYAQEDCIFWPGYALFVYGETSNIELSFHVPDHWNVSTPWHRIGGEKHRFTITDRDDLIYAYMVLGTHSERVAKSEEAEVVLAIGGRFKTAANEIQDTVTAFLQAYSEIFGGTPKGRMLFVANPYGEEGHMEGGVSGRSISVLIGGTLDETSKRFWVPLVGHEVVHIWNGTAINFREQEYWFSEGFTEYYSRIVSAGLGLTSENEFLENLERACEAYLSKQGHLSIYKAGEDKGTNRGLVYQGGSLVAAALDVQIRKLTQNRNNLDDVMKQMYQEFGLTRVPYTLEDVVRIVNQITGEDFEPFFHSYVSGTKRLPLTEYLADAGIDVRIEFGEELPSGNYVIHQMLRINSLTQTGKGLIIHRSPKVGYQDEDNLIAINGKSVKTFNDLRRLAKDWNAGDLVALTLQRNGEEIIMSITLGGTTEELPMEIENVNVILTKRADSTDSQRAIWTDILGSRR